MAINLPPIANPEKVGSFNTNFKMIQDELDNVIRRGGLGVGEPNHMEIDLDMNGNAILNASTDLGNSKSLITVGDADKRYLEDVSADIAGKVDKAGDTMSGTLDMGSNLISNLASPVQDTDAARKAYVDALETKVMDLLKEVHPLKFLTAGESYGGGYYAGAGITVSGITYILIVAPKSTGEAQLPWEWTADPDVTGAESTNDGAGNTSAIVTAGGSSSGVAAGFCDSLTIDGRADWTLPSPDELEICHRYLKPGTQANETGGRVLHMTTNGTNPNSSPVGDGYTTDIPSQTSSALFQEGGSEAFEQEAYWTSMQIGSGSAWVQEFSDGDQTAYTKSTTQYVRAVRWEAIST